MSALSDALSDAFKDLADGVYDNVDEAAILFGVSEIGDLTKEQVIKACAEMYPERFI